ncbi:MAG: hypothetical protein SGPRY_003959 [Prymnesium sp.]
MTGHRPLLLLLFGASLERWFEEEHVAYALGAKSSLSSVVCGCILCWAFFYIAAMCFYNFCVPLCVNYYAYKYPKAPTSQVAPPLVQNMIEVSHRALPLYVTVPVLTDLFQSMSWAKTCYGIQDCGGWMPSLLACVAYFAFLEIMIFLDHYYLLHKFDLGKRIGQHAQHHVFKYANQLNGFSAYSFTPQDGWSQGLALAVGTLVVPVPIAFVYTMEILTGLWTVYIHTDVTPLPWPFMGCDYHYIHHRYNWYNFGFMTVTMDTIFRTVKHPKNKSWNPGDALDRAHGRIPMPEDELKRSAILTNAILSTRGATPCELMRCEDEQEVTGRDARRRHAFNKELRT